MANKLLEAALRYAGYGILVLPLKSGGKTPLTTHGLHDATTDADIIRDWWEQWPDANVGLATGAESGFFVVDIDGAPGELSLEALEMENDQLPDTRQSLTGGGGRHIFFKWPEFTIKNFNDGRLGKGFDVRGEGGYIVAPPSIHKSGVEYAWDGDPPSKINAASQWLLDKLARGKTAKVSPVENQTNGDGKIREGGRHQALVSLAGKLRSIAASESEILAGLEAYNERRCDPPKPLPDLEKIARDIANRYSPATTVTQSKRSSLGPLFPWPAALRPEALHGIAGEIVRAIDPHTEADQAAVLTQLLAGFGNIIGRDTYWTAEADRHHSNLFVVLVGDTAKGRKGTSWGRVKRILELADPKWAKGNIISGLSSGEGLIHHVRDARSEQKPIREKGEVVGYEEVQADPGIEDKRLFVVESEFSRVLKVCDRESNTLSDVLRLAWDGNQLRTLTKQAADIATGAHISLVGHITQDELRKLLTTAQSANGFGNRFLWVCVRRSKLLPEGGRFHEVDLAVLARQLLAAVEFAESAGELERDLEAAAVWKQIYGPLSEGGRGLFGSLTSRAEAQVMRLAATYAVLDCSPVITAEHLNAGLAVWEYCENSARYLFGRTSGDPVADRIRDAVHQSPEGLSRDQLRKLFSGHIRAEQLDSALELLQKEGTVKVETRKTAGRPAEVIHAVE